MDNSTGNQNQKTKTLLIDKELKTNDLMQTAADLASGSTTKPNPKPESNPRIASAGPVWRARWPGYPSLHPPLVNRALGPLSASDGVFHETL